MSGNLLSGIDAETVLAILHLGLFTHQTSGLEFVFGRVLSFFRSLQVWLSKLVHMICETFAL